MNTILTNPIRSIREKLGYSRDEFAHKLGLSGRSAISNYENNIRVPELSVAYKILDLINTSYPDLSLTLEDIYPRENHTLK